MVTPTAAANPAAKDRRKKTCLAPHCFAAVSADSLGMKTVLAVVGPRLVRTVTSRVPKLSTETLPAVSVAATA